MVSSMGERVGQKGKEGVERLFERQREKMQKGKHREYVPRKEKNKAKGTGN